MITWTKRLLLTRSTLGLLATNVLKLTSGSDRSDPERCSS